jgi:uroporphyrinogen decarboxylase
VSTQKLLLAALRGERTERVPFWFMRQAGRYLSEYRRLRAQAGGFLDLCLDPTLATEVTLQPVARFGMDAAILFSDILMVPHGLGQPVTFTEGEGPKLDRLIEGERLPTLDRAAFAARLAPVYDTVAELVPRLPDGCALIGFAGAPWTVATYMIEGGTSRDFGRTKERAYHDPAWFAGLIGLLVEATVEHLSAQIRAGAEAVQLFDSWAGALSPAAFERWSIAPTRAIVAALRERHPVVPIIGFPRAAGAGYLDYAAGTGVNAIGLDTSVPCRWAARELQGRAALQGNLDPQLLAIGGAAMLEETEAILEALGKGPFVFNLGHGIVPETPVEHVAQLSQRLRAWHRPR